MKIDCFKSLALLALAAAANSLLAASVKFEAETGAFGADYTNGVDGATQFISIASNQGGSAPSNSTRMATYVITFPAAGTYELYGRVRVGPADANDDSFFYPNGFDLKSPTNAADWVLVNSVNSGGFTNAGDVVAGSGTAGNRVWKWINFSQSTGAAGGTPISFNVSAGELVQTFQIGAREDGFDIDAFVFGTAGYTFAVSNLDAGTDGTPPPAAVTGSAKVNWSDVRQRIDGFGASSAWRSSTNRIDRYFSTNTGIGLSLLRSRIAPGGTTIEGGIMQWARNLGARVWSAPWTPTTNAFKTTNTNGVYSLNGGSFIGNASNYQAYASVLARYVVNMKNTYGVTLYALSVQNEPDYITTAYESCGWTAQQIHDFVPYLSAALTASNVASTKILLPESESWGSGPGLYTTTMTDPNTAPLVGIIANHNYVQNNNVGDQTTPAALNSYGKALWETEVSTFSPYDPSMTNGIYWAKRLHAFLTVAQVNAWHYWWLNASDNSGIADSNDNLAKRGYVLGQFSRFVRPDFYRTGVTPDFVTTLVSAYKDPNSGKFAIVAINPNLAQGLDLTVNLTNSGSVSSVTPWITSSSLSLAAQSAVIVSNSVFFYSLPAASVVTFVGQGLPTNSAPTDIALSASTVAENQPSATTVGTFSTSDPDSGSAFTYSLVSGTGSADNAAFTISSNALRTVASFDYESKDSYSIRIRSSDQFNLSFEKIFSVTVTNANDAPVLMPVVTQTNNAGVTLVITNVATDQDLPVQTLTFSLLSATPTNAILDATSGVFTWRPLVSQADTTNMIVVKVSDDGTPSLSDTNSFAVKVNSLSQPRMDSISTTGGQVSLVVSGPEGPDYTLRTSTNLIAWEEVLTTNSPVPPVTITDTNFTDAARFYRIQLGP